MASEPQYDIHIERDIMVSMRDGVRLAPALYWDDFPDIPMLIVGGWYDS